MPTSLPMPSQFAVLKRGFMCRCPNCGKGRLFRAYLKIADHCDVCGEQLGHIRADDLPAYLTIAIVGHIVVFGMLTAVQRGVSNLVGITVSIVFTISASLWLLPHIKGAVAAHLWRLKIPQGSVEAEG